MDSISKPEKISEKNIAIPNETGRNLKEEMKSYKSKYSIVLKDFKMRYRTELPLVLKGL